MPITPSKNKTALKIEHSEIISKRDDLGTLAKRLEEDIERIADGDNQQRLTTLYQSVLSELKKIESITAYMDTMESLINQLRNEMSDRMPSPGARFLELYPSVNTGDTHSVSVEDGSEETKGDDAHSVSVEDDGQTKKAILKAVFEKLTNPEYVYKHVSLIRSGEQDVKRIVEELETEFLKHASSQLEVIDQKTSQTAIVLVAVAELRTKRQELYDCLQFIAEELPRHADGSLFEQNALQNVNTKVQAQIATLLSAVEQDNSQVTDAAVASANELLTDVEKLLSRLNKVKNSFVSDLRKLKEDLQWLNSITGENRDLMVNPNKPRPRKAKVVTLGSDEPKTKLVKGSDKPKPKKVEKLRRLDHRRASLASSSSSGSSQSAETQLVPYHLLVKEYIELLLKPFDLSVKADEIKEEGEVKEGSDVSAEEKKIEAIHSRIKRKETSHLRPYFINTIRKRSAAMGGLSAIAMEPVIFENPNDLKRKDSEQLKQIINKLLAQEERLKAAKSKLISDLQTESASISKLDDAAFKRMFELLSEHFPDEYQDQTFESFKAQFDEFNNKVQSISEHTPSTDLKTMADVSECIKKMKQDCERLEERLEERLLERRLQVNAAIHQNGMDWRALIGEDLFPEPIKINGITVSIENLVPLEKDVTMLEIEEEEARQRQLKVILSEKQSAKQNAIDEDPWSWYHTKTRLHKLLWVRDILDDLQRENFNLASKALSVLTGLIKKMQAANEETESKSYDSETMLDWNIKEQYNKEVKKHLSVPELKLDKTNVPEQCEIANRLERARAISLQTIVADVLSHGESNAASALQALIKKECETQRILDGTMKNIADILAQHYDKNAAGKKKIEKICDEFQEKSSELSCEILSNENEDTTSLFKALSALRAKKCLAEEALKKIGNVAEQRLNVFVGKKVVLEVVNFCDYCLRKLKGETKAKTYGDSSRYTLYSRVRKMAEGEENDEVETSSSPGYRVSNSLNIQG